MAELALPLTISQFFTFALGLLTVAFIGRLGEEQMAVAVLATSFSNVTGELRRGGGSCMRSVPCLRAVGQATGRITAALPKQQGMRRVHCLCGRFQFHTAPLPHLLGSQALAWCWAC